MMLGFISFSPTYRAWQYLKGNYLSQRVFDSYNDIVDVCQTAWDKITAEKGRVKSLTNFPYI